MATFAHTAPAERGSSAGPQAGMLIARLAMLVGALTLVAWTTADPDLWGHLRFGLDILRDHTIASRDPYSFTSDRPWVNHEWLAEIVIALAYLLDGPRGLVTLKLVVVCGIVGLVLLGLRHRRWDPISHDLLIAATIFGIFGRIHTVRPQLFSVLLCAALLLALSLADRGRRALLLLVPVLMALWANVHGGFLVGLGIIGVWAAVRFCCPQPHGPARAHILAVAVASAGATVANPYGPQLWLFLGQTVGISRVDITDWQPLWTTGYFIITQWAVVTAVGVLSFMRGRVDLAYAALAAALCLATVIISRFDAFYTLAVIMLLGPSFGRPGAPRQTTVRPRVVAVLAGVGAVAVAAVALAERSSCIEIRVAPEPDATRFAQRQRGRMLTFFDWGQYGIWHLAPAIQVSMDGRRETVYSEAVLNSHIRIYANAPDAIRLVESMNADWIWLPRDWQVIGRLESDGWYVAFRGPLSVILSRQPVSRVQTQDIPASPRCFPQY
jgi:hypothetical protein